MSDVSEWEDERDLLKDLLVIVNAFPAVPTWLLDLALGIDRPKGREQGDYET